MSPGSNVTSIAPHVEQRRQVASGQQVEGASGGQFRAGQGQRCRRPALPGGGELHGIRGQTLLPEGKHAHSGGADLAILGVQQMLKQFGFDEINRLIHPKGLEEILLGGLFGGPTAEVD